MKMWSKLVAHNSLTYFDLNIFLSILIWILQLYLNCVTHHITIKPFRRSIIIWYFVDAITVSIWRDLEGERPNRFIWNALKTFYKKYKQNLLNTWWNHECCCVGGISSHFAHLLYGWRRRLQWWWWWVKYIKRETTIFNVYTYELIQRIIIRYCFILYVCHRHHPRP